MQYDHHLGRITFFHFSHGVNISVVHLLLYRRSSFLHICALIWEWPGNGATQILGSLVPRLSVGGVSLSLWDLRAGLDGIYHALCMLSFL